MSSSLTIGLFFAYSTVIGELIAPYGDEQAELLGALLNGSGLVGSIAIVLVIDYVGISLVRANQLVSFMSLVVLGAFWLFIQDAKADIGTVITLGFVNVPILFVAYELGVEQACTGSKLGEATPVGIINMIGNGIGFIEIMALTPILKGRKREDSDISLGILVIL